MSLANPMFAPTGPTREDIDQAVDAFNFSGDGIHATAVYADGDYEIEVRNSAGAIIHTFPTIWELQTHQWSLETEAPE